MKKMSMDFSELPTHGNIAIYGTGKRGQDYFKIISICRPDVTTVCFLDSFKEDKTSSPPILKASSVNPDSFNVDSILICSNFYPEIILHLRKLGLSPHSSISTFIADWFVDILSAEESQKCEDMLKHLLDKLSDAPFVYDALGRLEGQRSNYELALFYHKQASYMFPADIWGHVGCAKTLTDMNRFDEAEEVYRSIVAKYPDNPAGYLGCASVFQAVNRLDESEEMYRCVIAKFPDNPDGYQGCASIFQVMNRFDEAEEVYRSVVARFPDNPAGYLGCASVSRAMNRFDEAEEMYRSVIVKFPDYHAVYIDCAAFFRTINRLDEAVEMYRSVIVKFPDYPDGYVGYATISQAMNRLDESEKMFRSVIARFPDYPASYERYSDMLLTFGRAEEAEQLLLSCGQRFVNRADVVQFLQDAYILQGKITEAKELLSTLVNFCNYRNNGNAQRQKPLLFNHIFKCGGSSVTTFLLQNYSNQLAINANIFRANYKSIVNYYLSLSDEEKQLYSLIHSHGAEHLLPHVPANTIKAVVLRNPIEKLFSWYYFNLSNAKFSKSEENLFDFVDKATNSYVYMFCTSEERNNLKESELVKKCYLNLNKQYDLVGITEEMDSFLGELQFIAELPVPYTGTRKNITTKRKALADIDPGVVELAKNKLSLDIELYELVKNDWGNKVEV
ncbi:hypothetical protein JCM15519_01250 [Fundidesulfovibrio butyratiphilus]